MQYEYIHNDEKLSIDLDISGESCKVRIEGSEKELDFRYIDEHTISLLNSDGNIIAFCARSDNAVHVFIDGEKYVLKEISGEADFGGEAGGFQQEKGLVTTPMPGTIIKFLVDEGDPVEIDQGLVIVEAMKMENEIRSTVKGKVIKLNFNPGDAVNIGVPIIDLEEVE